MATEHEARAHEIRMFTPNVLLPAQVLRPPATSWLRRLYMAILSDALDCRRAKGHPAKCAVPETSRAASRRPGSG
jgi:hypothetical protein